MHLPQWATASLPWLGVAVYLALEWWLPRTRWFKANSTVEAVANIVKATLLAKVPLVGWAATRLSTVESTTPVLELKKGSNE